MPIEQATPEQIEISLEYLLRLGEERIDGVKRLQKQNDRWKEFAFFLMQWWSKPVPAAEPEAPKVAEVVAPAAVTMNHELLVFAQLMDRRLRENDPDPAWGDTDALTLYARVLEEANKVFVELSGQRNVKVIEEHTSRAAAYLMCVRYAVMQDAPF